LRIYDEETMLVLLRAKTLIDEGINASEAFGRARAEIEREEQHHD
jgi:hypothetical protein